MSAAFKIRNDIAWGSNGAIELYLERMSQRAAQFPAIDERLIALLNHWRQVFFPRAVVCLDEILVNPNVALQFLTILDSVTSELLSGNEFSETGKQWLREEIPKLRAAVALAA